MLMSVQCICLIFSCGLLSLCQVSASTVEGFQTTSSSPAVVASTQTDDRSPSNYVLGPNDKLVITIQQLDEIKQFEVAIDLQGNISLPLLGLIHAGDATLERLKSAVDARARRFVRNPDISIFINDFRSQPISILGAVNNPGVNQLQGQRTLVEVISMAGGLRPDAGTNIQITRELKWGQIPLPGAKTDPSGQYSVASVSVRKVLHATDPSENIPLRPRDVVTVPKADLVYCVGSVRRPGGFPIAQSESLSALQVLSLAEGLDKNAAPDHARILRTVPGSQSRTEIPVNLKKLTGGQTLDIHLQSDDILFVPSSLARSASSRTFEAIIQAATGVAIYGRY